MWNTNRFFREINGELGDFWKRDAQKRLDKIVEDYNNGELIIKDGVGQWKRSKHIIPDECAFYAEYMGLPIDREATAKAHEAEMDEFFANYQPPKMTDEMLYEMRAAFGEGTTVVDVVTGKKYRL